MAGMQLLLLLGTLVAERPVSLRRFQMEPIAAASLGQVHLARVNGRRVVVKVQRPFLREIFDVDLKNIRVLAQIFQAADPKSDGAARDWVAIYDECSRILYQVRSDLRLRSAAEIEDWRTDIQCCGCTTDE